MLRVGVKADAEYVLVDTLRLRLFLIEFFVLFVFFFHSFYLIHSYAIYRTEHRV